MEIGRQEMERENTPGFFLEIMKTFFLNVSLHVYIY